MTRILFVISEDWALVSHRLHLIRDAVDAGHSVAVATRVTTFKPLLEGYGVKVFDWCLNRGSLNLSKELKTIWGLGRILRHFKPDLVHCVALKPVIYTGIASRFGFAGSVVSALGGVGYIFSSRTLKAKLLSKPVAACLRFSLYGRRRSLILQNNDDLGLFLSYNVVTSDKVFIVPGAGVETDMFKYEQIRGDRCIVILPARLLRDKGVQEFVTAAEKIRGKDSNFEFWLVGDVDHDNPAAFPEDQIAAWEAGGLIKHVKGISHLEMPNIYAQSTIVCLPSYREGFPKSLLEGASVGRPLVAFDVPGCREIVIDGFNGKLVPFGDVDALINAIFELGNDRQKCLEMGLNGRTMVENQFSASIVNNATARVWRLTMDSS